MAVQRRKTTSARPPIGNHDHVSNSRPKPVLPTESTVPYLQLQRVVGVGLFVVATVVLFGISLPSASLPSSLGALAALSLALGTLLFGTASISRSAAKTTEQASPTSDEKSRIG